VSSRVVLPGPPSLGALYRSAGASAARGAVRRPLPVPMPSAPTTAIARRARRTTPAPVPVLPDLTVASGGLRGDAERAAAFQHLVGGVVVDTLHPGFVHVLAFPVAVALLARDDVPLPLLGMVHLANRVTQHRPARVGEELAVEVALSALRPHRRGAEVDVIATVTADGETVLTDVSTYLAPGVGAPSGPARDAEDGDDADRRSGEPPRAAGRWNLSADTGRRYAEVSGDVNPIHLSSASARPFGFPRAIAHGMHTASRALTASRVPLDGPLTWEVEFGAPVLLPSAPEISHTRQDDGTVRTELWRPARGERPARRHLVATARAAL
jgi:acyl dehydratase